MSVKRSGVFLSRTAVVSGCVSAFFLLVGFGSPSWISADRGRNDSLKFGLWKACYKEGNGSICKVSNNFLVEGWNEEWLPGVQSMMTLALISALICVVCLLIYALMPRLNYQNVAAFVALNSSFTTGVLTFLSVLVFGVQQANDHVSFYNTTLHWGFAVTVISLFLIGFTCVLMMLEYYELLFAKSEIKQKLSLHRQKLLEIINSEIFDNSPQNGEKNEDGAVYNDPANSVFETPLEFENAAYVSGTTQRKRRGSRHVYDNNIPTREGFRVYDNAVRKIDQNDNCTTKPLANSTHERNELEEHGNSELKQGSTPNSRKANDVVEALNPTGSKKSTEPAVRKVPVELFQASKSRNNSNKRHRQNSTKSARETNDKDHNSQTSTHLFSVAQNSNYAHGKEKSMADNATEASDSATETVAANLLQSEETSATDKQNGPLSRTEDKSRNCNSPIDLENDVTTKADIHDVVSATTADESKNLGDKDFLSTSPVTVVENDIYEHSKDSKDAKYF